MMRLLQATGELQPLPLIGRHTSASAADLIITINICVFRYKKSSVSQRPFALCRRLISHHIEAVMAGGFY